MNSSQLSSYQNVDSSSNELRNMIGSGIQNSQIGQEAAISEHLDVNRDSKLSQQLSDQPSDRLLIVDS